jgi:hypothetical protein
MCHIGADFLLLLVWKRDQIESSRYVSRDLYLAFPIYVHCITINVLRVIKNRLIYYATYLSLFLIPRIFTWWMIFTTWTNVSSENFVYVETHNGSHQVLQLIITMNLHSLMAVSIITW